MIYEGEDGTYNCTVASSNRTNVQWVFGGSSIPECNSFRPSSNATCPSEKSSCVTSSVSVTEELFLVRSLILYLCSVTANIAGQYTCEVQGINEAIVKDYNLITQQSIEVSVHNMRIDTHIDDISDDRSNKIMSPLIIACGSSPIFIMLIVIVIMMIRIFRYVKNLCASRETLAGIQESELTLTRKVFEEDNWEFPRDKLKLLQKIGKIVANDSYLIKCIYYWCTLYYIPCRCWQFWSSIESKSRRDSARFTAH